MPKEGPFLLEIRLDTAEQGTQSAYNEIYEQGGLSQLPSFYHWLIEKMRLPEKGRFLDISCGAGEIVHLAAKRGMRTTGVDISYLAAQSALRRVGSRVDFSTSAGEYLPFPDDTFDVVANIGSLEHFNQIDLGVQEMARVLKPGGKAFVFVPNTFSLLTNVWIAFRQGKVSVDNQPVQRYGTRLDWTLILENNGLKVKRVMKYERPWPRIKSDYGHYLGKPKELLRLIASPFIPLNLAFCFLFDCKKQAG